MELDGSLVDNLTAAVRSMRRLRGKSVYPQTLQFWRDLLATTHRVLATMTDENSPKVRLLADQLEDALRGFDKAQD